MKEEVKKPRRRVKKVKGHAGHHGGAWKVAYADFVTAMMALFLVLWLVSQADTKVKQSIASYFRSPGVFSSMEGGVLSQAKKVSKEPTSLTSKDDEQTLFSVAQNLHSKFSSRPEFSTAKDQVKISVNEEGLQIQIIDKADKVSFESGKADISSEASAILSEISIALCELPNKINIGGHTDSYVFGSDKRYTNWELSADRANAARRVLESACVKPEQIHRIIGFADTQPTVPEDRFAPANRRISITVLRLPDPENKEVSASGDSAPAANKPQINPDKSLQPKEQAAAAKTKPQVLPPRAAASPAAPAAPPSDSQEKQKAKAKLLAEGSVVVGKPDEIPAKPVIKQTETAGSPDK